MKSYSQFFVFLYFIFFYLAAEFHVMSIMATSKKVLESEAQLLS